LAYPLDTLRTLVYCDLKGEYKGGFDALGKISHSNGWEHLYRGLGCKLTYNAAFIWHLHNLYESNA